MIIRDGTANEVGEVISRLLVVIVMEALDGRVLDRAVHELNLAIDPRGLTVVSRCSIGHIAILNVPKQ